MNGRVLHISEISQDDEKLWRDLETCAVEPNPLFGPDCLIPAAHCLPGGNDILLNIAEEEGKFYGCFPIISVAGVNTRIASLPGVRRGALTTYVRRLRLDGTPLMRPERELDTAETLLLSIVNHGHETRTGILVLEALRDDGPVAHSLSRAARNLDLPIRNYQSYMRPVVRRRDDTTYQNIHRADRRREIARKGRRMGELLGGDAQVVERGSEESAIEQFLKIEGAGYKGETGIALDNHPGESDWLREMCNRLRKADRLLLYSLQFGNSVVAMQLIVRGGVGLFSLFIVYDQDFAKFSPGNQLHLEVINRFHESTDAQWLDSCTFEGNEHFLWAYPDRQRVTTLMIPFGGRLDELYTWLYSFAVSHIGDGSEFRSRHRRLAKTLSWVEKKIQR